MKFLLSQQILSKKFSPFVLDNLKNFFAIILSKSGALDLVHRLLYGQSAVILMYHRVIPFLSVGIDYVQPGMYVSVKSFRRHAALLKEKFEVISLADIVTRLHLGKSVAGCCAITFDDGWLDNFTHAFGVLQEFKLPATVFLASSFIGTDKHFWPEQLSFYLRQPEMRRTGKYEAIIHKFYSEVIPAIDEESFIDNAIVALKSWSPDKRDELLDCLRAITTCPGAPRLLMNWDEVLEMHRSGLVDFGSHTVNHEILDQIPLDKAREEIVCSRDEIEAFLGVPVTLFAYPNGNFNAPLLNVVKEIGYTGAVTTKSGWVACDTNVLSIPRIGLHEDVGKTKSRFYARLVFQRF